jgi:CRP-like cAMP-binding protein
MDSTMATTSPLEDLMGHDPISIGAERLHNVPGMETMPSGTRARVDQLSTELRIPAGQRLIRKGNPGRETFLILDGTVAVRSDEDILAVRSRGSLIGEVAVLTQCPRNADVVALTDLVTLVMSPAELATLCEDRAFRRWLDDQLGAHALTA